MTIIKGKKFVSMMCVTALLGGTTFSGATAASEMIEGKTEAPTEVVQEPTVAEVPAVEVPVAETPVVEAPAPAPVAEPVAVENEEAPVTTEVVNSVEPEIANESEATTNVTPAPEAEKDESAVVAAATNTISFTFMLEDGTVVGSGSKTDAPGTSFAIAAPAAPAGSVYHLVDFAGDEFVDLNVLTQAQGGYPAGTLVLNGVIPPAGTSKSYTVTIKEVVHGADITVLCVDENGNKIPDTTVATAGGMVNDVITIPAISIPGYELVSANEQTVTVSGVAQEIQFVYKAIQKETLTFNLVLGNGSPIDTVTVTNIPGEAFSVPLPAAPAGSEYHLVDFAGDEYVTIDVLTEAQGGYPAGTLFIHGVVPPAGTPMVYTVVIKEVVHGADITVLCVDEDGNVIPGITVATAGGMVNDVITIPAISVPGYELVSPNEQTVTVTNTEQTIQFVYKELPISVPVEFVDENNNPVIGAPSYVIDGMAGEEVPVNAPEIPGYIYEGPATVTLPSDGSSIVLVYKRVKVTLTVVCVDEAGTSIFKNEEFTGHTGEKGTLTPAVIPGYTFKEVKSIVDTKADSLATKTAIPYTFTKTNQTMTLVYTKNPSVIPGVNPGKPDGDSSNNYTPINNNNNNNDNNNNNNNNNNNGNNNNQKPKPGQLPQTGEAQTMTSVIGMLILGFMGVVTSRFRKEQ